MSPAEEPGGVTSYDIIPYPSYPYSQSHPNRTMAIAMLFGMKPPNPQKARILELGCADGANLIPLAVQFPHSEFLGIDLSAKEIENGNKIINALKLDNIEIDCLNILDIDKKVGEFDYIIAHGIYSWIPAEVRHKLLTICKEQLSPNGIAYISYNTYPGWHMRGMLRDMMRYHTRQLQDEKQKIQQARALINFLTTSVPVENNPYGMLLHNELEQMKKWQDNYFRHDSLEDVNDPVYFYQFIESAMAQGLQYLGEADFSSMVHTNFAKEIVETLQRVANNIVSMEQYMDFLRNRMFRQTLLCHHEVPLTRNVSPVPLKSLYFASGVQAVNQNPEIMSDKPETYTHLGRQISSNAPPMKALWSYFQTVWPQAINFEDISKALEHTLKKKLDEKILFDLIFSNLAKGIAQVYAIPFPLTLEVGKHPKTSPLIRYQAQCQNWVTNLKHEPVFLNPLQAKILTMADGKHDKKDFIKELEQMIEKGQITLTMEGKQVQDKKQSKQVITEQFDTMMHGIAKMGLLMD